MKQQQHVLLLGLSFNVAVGPDRGPVLVGEGGELQAVEGEDALAHVLLGVVATRALTVNKNFIGELAGVPGFARCIFNTRCKFQTPCKDPVSFKVPNNIRTRCNIQSRENHAWFGLNEPQIPILRAHRQSPSIYR